MKCQSRAAESLAPAASVVVGVYSSTFHAPTPNHSLGTSNDFKSYVCRISNAAFGSTMRHQPAVTSFRRRSPRPDQNTSLSSPFGVGMII